MTLRMMTIIALAAATPLHAEPVKSQMTVGVQRPPPPIVVAPIVSPYYPYIPLRPRPRVRCEQDRLLTDTRPCGEESAEPPPPVPQQ